MDNKRRIQERKRGSAKEILRVTWIGFWVNVFLSALKIFAGFFGDSRAVIADGVHSLSDLVTDIAVLVGARFWVVPPDENHAYGHSRLESLISLSIGISLGLAGVGIAYDAFSRIGLQQGGQAGSPLALFAALFSLFSKEILYRWTKKKARELKSDAMEANAWHHRSDAISSLPVALAVIVAMSFPALAVVDLVAAVLVAGFIIYAAWKICKNATYILLDGGCEPVVRDRIIAFTMRVEGVKDVHCVRTRFLGQGILLDMHVGVDAALSIREGNVIAHRVEDALCSPDAEAYIGVEICDALVHIDPWQEG